MRSAFVFLTAPVSIKVIAVLREGGKEVLIFPVLEDSSKSELFSRVNRTVGNFLMMVKREGRVWLVGLRSALREGKRRVPSMLSRRVQRVVTWMEFLLKLSSILKRISVFAALSCSFAASVSSLDSWNEGKQTGSCE